MKAENKIYSAYFDLKSNELYYNQIREHSNLSHSSTQNALKKLIDSDILKTNKTKSNIFYKIKNKKKFELKFCELAITKFENLNIGVKIPLINFLNNFPKDVFSVILFGSSAKKQEKKGSDIDLLIVSNKKIDIKKYKKEAEITSKYHLSIFQTNIQDFINNNDDIIIQAKKTGFPIYKEQNFYEVFLNECF